MRVTRAILLATLTVLIIWAANIHIQDSSRGIPFVKNKYIKAIGIYSGSSPLDVSPPSAINNPVLTANDITDINARYVSDPFVIREGSSWLMFFGVRNKDTRQGDIGLAKSSDGITWEYQKIILDEPFHVSYPHVFKWQSEYYLLPESPDAGSIRLYKAIEYPYQWKLAETILQGNYADPSLFRYKGFWWMFAETNPDGNDRLSLFYAKKLTGPWLEHPLSPIINRNAHIARPGGRVINFNGQIIRFAQDDEPYYGKQLWAFEITRLTTTEYLEEQIGDGPILQGGNMDWNNMGIFYINPYQISKGSWHAYVGGHGKSLRFSAEH